MVTKKFRTMSALLALTMGLSLMTGCGKKKASVDPEDMIEKYAAFCELGEYKGIEYEKTVYEVSDEAVEYQINSLIEQHKTYEEVKDGIAESGDKVNIDFVGTVDGEEFSGGNTNGAGYDVTLGAGTMIPGFEDGIIGHSVGEKFDIDVTFPENYQNEDELEEGQTLLNGKAAVFEITINSLSRPNTPVYNDAFIASNTDYSTVSEYESALRNDMELSYADRMESANRSAVMTVVEENSKINEYPEQELKQLIDDAINSVSETAAAYGYTLAQYATSVYGMASEDEFREYVSNLAEGYIKEKILVCAIAKAEGMTVTDEDKKAQKQEMMEELQIDDEDDFDKSYTDEDVTYYTISEKVYDFLLENAVGVVEEDDDNDNQNEDTSDTTEDDKDNDNEDAATVTDASPSDATKSDAE